MTPTKQALLAEFAESLPCIQSGCDRHGSIAEPDGDGGWEQSQCQFCDQVRFPAIARFAAALDRVERETFLKISKLDHPELPGYDGRWVSYEEIVNLFLQSGNGHDLSLPTLAERE